METKELVLIEKVDGSSVTYSNGLSAHRDNFPGVKPGQEWEVTTTDRDPKYPNVVWPLGVIVSTRLVTDVP